MGKIIATLSFLFLSLTCNATATFNIWYIQSDTTTQGQSFSVFIKGSYTNSNDTGRIYIKDLSTTNFVELYKIKVIDLLSTTPTGPDDTYEIIVTIPSYTKDCEMFGNGQTMPRNPVYVRSNTPDLLLIGGYGPFSGSPNFASYFKVEWTYEALPTDSLEIYLDAVIYKKIAITDLEGDSVVNFTLPATPGVYSLHTNYVTNLSSGSWIDYTVNAVVTGLFGPLNTKHKITFYLIDGTEIKKPTEGLFIWKSSNGESGKVFIVP